MCNDARKCKRAEETLSPTLHVLRFAYLRFCLVLDGRLLLGKYLFLRKLFILEYILYGRFFYCRYRHRASCAGAGPEPSLLDTGGLAGEAPEVVKLGAAHNTV